MRRVLWVVVSLQALNGDLLKASEGNGGCARWDLLASGAENAAHVSATCDGLARIAQTMRAIRYANDHPVRRARGITTPELPAGGAGRVGIVTPLTRASVAVLQVSSSAIVSA